MIHNLDNKGFTLLEMLTAISIIVLLSAVVAVNFRGFSSSSSLDSAVESVSSLIRQTQLWSLTGQTRGSDRPAGGWGVHLEECTQDNCTYFMFADMWPADPNPPNRVYDEGENKDEKVVDFALPNIIHFQSLSPKSSQSLDIVFDIPEAAVYFNNSQAETEATITLNNSISGDSKSIKVDQLTGRINIE
jgi:prepilin-type N-terminal cleavage/methylation domain-containing protein